MSRMGVWRFAMLLGIVFGPLVARDREDPKVQTTTRAKAGVIAILAEYSTWPKGREKEALVIGVLGESSLVEDLATECHARTFHGRRVKVVSLEDTLDMERCDILVVGEGQASRLGWALKNLQKNPILTVGEEPGLAKGGVMVNILIEKGRPVIEVNLAAIRRSGLMLSSRVLQVARIVEG